METVTLDARNFPMIYADMELQFPPDELKPMPYMQKLFDRGVNSGFLVPDKDGFQAYALFIRAGDPDFQLLDYYAIRKDLQGKGIGSALMRQIREEMSCRWLLLEVEDPEYAADEADLDVRNRRLAFYFRSGLTDTGVRVFLFGVHYVILVLPKDGAPCTRQQAWDGLAELYRNCIPPEKMPNFDPHSVIF